MSNKNYQDIINRIYEIYKELGISAGDSSNTPSEDSIKSVAEKILNNLISNPANSVGESIEVIKNKVLQIKSNTESVNNYLAPLKQKFDNIYNELNSTSSSYMKGKVNGIYSTVLDIYNILFSTGSGSIEQSLENLKDRGKFTYYGITDLTMKSAAESKDLFTMVYDNYYHDISLVNPISSLSLPEKDAYFYDFRFQNNRTKMRYVCDYENNKNLSTYNNSHFRLEFFNQVHDHTTRTFDLKYSENITWSGNYIFYIYTLDIIVLRTYGYNVGGNVISIINDTGNEIKIYDVKVYRKRK